MRHLIGVASLSIVFLTGAEVRADETPLKYELWEDRLAALRELVRQMHD